MTETIKDINKTISLKIEELRKEKKLSQRQLAARAGISQAQISYILAAREGSTIKNYLNIARALDVSFFELMTTGARNCSNCGNLEKCNVLYSCPKNNFYKWSAGK